MPSYPPLSRNRELIKQSLPHELDVSRISRGAAKVRSSADIGSLNLERLLSYHRSEAGSRISPVKRAQRRGCCAGRVGDGRLIISHEGAGIGFQPIYNSIAASFTIDLPGTPS
jgi:hypothetical protein